MYSNHYNSIKNSFHKTSKHSFFKKLKFNLRLIITRGRPAVEIRPLFIKFLSLNVIEVFFYQRVYFYNHCIYFF
jgi:hypothetical protein